MSYCQRSGKIKHASAGDAHASFRNGRAARKRLRVYRCEFCDGYHVTSQEIDTNRREVVRRGD